MYFVNKSGSEVSICATGRGRFRDLADPKSTNWLQVYRGKFRDPGRPGLGAGDHPMNLCVRTSSFLIEMSHSSRRKAYLCDTAGCIDLGNCRVRLEPHYPGWIALTVALRRAPALAWAHLSEHEQPIILSNSGFRASDSLHFFRVYLLSGTGGLLQRQRIVFPVPISSRSCGDAAAQNNLGSRWQLCLPIYPAASFPEIVTCNNSAPT